MVKSIASSSRDMDSIPSTHTVAYNLPVAPISGDLSPSSGLHEAHRHTSKLNVYTHENK